MKKIDLTGQRFGRLIVLQRDEASERCNEIYWLCRCDCGKEKSISGSALRAGYTQSCGCLKRELLQNSRHLNKHLYQVWQDMKQRCNNPRNKYYDRYGVRGIKVCQEWADYDSFFTWAMAHGYAHGLQIDRIDNDGDYTPDNCRWATPKENTNNRAVCIKITHEGKTHTATEWAHIMGIPARTIISRYHAGKSSEEILKTE